MSHEIAIRPDWLRGGGPPCKAAAGRFGMRCLFSAICITSSPRQWRGRIPSKVCRPYCEEHARAFAERFGILFPLDVHEARKERR